MTRDNENVTILDGRDYCIIVTVDRNGVADARADGVGYRQAAEYMRAIAGLFAARADTEDAAGWTPPGTEER